MLTDQRQIVDALMNHKAYGEETGEIELKQTHISFVFLTGDFVYKIKKAVDFGFLNYSTLEKRRLFCEKEVELNRRLCGDMYLGVVPITKSEIIKIAGEGEVIEYAVKMKRIPEEKIMTRLLEKGKIDKKLVDKMAKIIAEFHQKTGTCNKTDEFGSLRVIEKNWKENFDQSKEFVDETISQESYNLIHKKVDEFMKRNEALFAKRIAENRVRECHGDIHSGNIFVADRIYIFDAIEFNERFRICDVASDVSFLAMDLDFKNRSDLSSFFIEKYIEYSGDKELEKVLSFYKCYRAYVRGKVVSFRLNDSNVGKEEKAAAKKEARAYFVLATEYARHL